MGEKQKKRKVDATAYIRATLHLSQNHVVTSLVDSGQGRFRLKFFDFEFECCMVPLSQYLYISTRRLSNTFSICRFASGHEHVPKPFHANGERGAVQEGMHLSLWSLTPAHSNRTASI